MRSKRPLAGIFFVAALALGLSVMTAHDARAQTVPSPTPSASATPSMHP